MTITPMSPLGDAPLQARNTMRAYKREWHAFQAWCEGHSYDSVPASVETVREYLTELLTGPARISAGRIRVINASIVYFQKVHAVDEDVRRGIRAECARIHKFAIRDQPRSSVSQAAPIDEQVWGRIERSTLRAIRRRGEKGWVTWSLYQDLALIAVMRDGLLRRSEASALDWQDLERTDDEGAGIVRRSKTDQYGEGRVFYLSSIAWEYLDRIAPAKLEGPVFVSRKSNRLSDLAINRRLKRAAERAGLDPERFSGHSCRVGTVHDLMRRRENVAAIALAGGWRSAAMPQLYGRKIAVADGAVARMRRGE